jgi:hypothetical protein
LGAFPVTGLYNQTLLQTIPQTPLQTTRFSEHQFMCNTKKKKETERMYTIPFPLKVERNNPSAV